MRTCPWSKGYTNNVTLISWSTSKSYAALRLFHVLNAFNIISSYHADKMRISYGGDPTVQYTVIASVKNEKRNPV